MRLVIICFTAVVTLLCGCQSDEGFTVVDEFSFLVTGLGELPTTIDECSGIANYNDQLYVINDKSAEDDFQILNPKTLISTSIELPLYNHDWESIIYHNQDLIIADTGNNKGQRDSLYLHHLDIGSLSHVHTTAFMYPEQTTSWSESHDFDCEGLAIINNHYYLFTKNRSNQNTNIYIAPIFTADFQLVDSIEVPMRVTDVYYDNSLDVILLLCNQKVEDNHVSYLKIMRVTNNFNFTPIVSLPLDINDKIEGITRKKNCTYYLGSERESGGSGKLYEIEIRGL